MFLHPYGGIDNYSDESTRRNTRRNADSSSATLDGGRVRRDKIGTGTTASGINASMGIPDGADNSSLLLQNVQSNLIQADASGGASTTSKSREVNSKMSLSGVFTLFSNFVQGNASTSNASSKPQFKEERKGSASARVNDISQGSTFSSKAQ